MPNPSPRDSQDTQVTRARASLRQALNRYRAYFRTAKNSLPNPGTQAALQQDAERLAATLNKLEKQTIRIAVFGLVSRGKSAVLNALVGQKVLPTGPLNGVTRSPQVISWLSVGKDAETRGHGDAGTRGYGDTETRGHGDMGTRGHGDTGTRGYGNTKATEYGTLEPTLSPSPPLRVPASSPLPRSASSLKVELIDTPGLDEIDGQARAQMAQEVARQSDLILFVVAGDITRTEYQALCQLRQSQKPLLLVFNKIDLYPEQTQQMIYQNLQRLAAKSGGESLHTLLSANEIVLVAADPAPLQVRVEQPDGRISYEWETPSIQIEPLKQAIVAILNQSGKTLLALNALVQARDADATLAREILDIHQPEAEALIWRYARYKAIVIALNPIAILDLIGGAISDLAMIRALAELYGLPITRHEARKIWQTILLSSGSLLVSELGSGILLGMGKSAIAGLDSSISFSAYAGIGLLQGAVAGYGAYTVGRAAQVYLEQGCSWGPQGANTVIQDILKQLDASTIIYRLRQELGQELGM